MYSEHKVSDMLEYKVHPVDQGQKTEVMILRELVRNDYRVSIPFGVNHRYDLIVDTGERLLRAQCKTARLEDGKLIFNATSGNGRLARRKYTNEIEIFLVYSPDLDTVYWLPIEEVSATSPHLRVDPPRNNQLKGVRWAHNYLLKPSQSPAAIV